MTKRQYTYITITFVFFLLALGFDYYASQATSLSKYQQAIETTLQQQEKNINDFFEDKVFIHRITNKIPTSLEQKEEDLRRLENLAMKSFTIHLYKEDSLIFWNNNFTSLPSRKYLKNSSDKKVQFIKHINGDYEVISQTLRDKTMGAYTIVAMIPIKNYYEIVSNYIKTRFIANPNIPANIDLLETPTDHPIKSRLGTTICYLSANEKLVDKDQQTILLWLYLLGILSLGIFLHSMAKTILRKYPSKPWLGAGFLIVSVFGIRLLSVFFNFSERFTDMPLFANNIQSMWSNSLSDLLINIGLLLWMMIFFHREYPHQKFNHHNSKIRFGITTLNYFAILLGIFALTGIFKALVFNSGITFNFDNVFDLDRYSLLAIIGVIFLLISLFIFSHRMMMAISKMGFNRYTRLGALSIAMLFSFPILWTSDFLLPWFFISVLAGLLILIFDVFIDSKKINFTWLVIWVIILSAFPSFLLFIYNTYKDRVVRLAYAKELVDLRDPIAEISFNDLKLRISEDPVFQEELSKPFPFKVNSEVLKKRLNTIFTSDNYLFYNYKYSLNVVHKFDDPNTLETTPAYLENRQQFLDAQATKNNTLKFWKDREEKKWAYLLNLNQQNPDQSDNPVSIMVQFDRNRREQSKVYTELLVDTPYKNLADLAKYEYAIYKDQVLIDSEGKIYGPSLTLEELPKEGKSLEESYGNRSEVIYAGKNNTVVIIGREKETFIKAISLFSYIFGILVIFIIAITFFNSIFQIVPGILDFSTFHKPSLKNRIQLSVITLTLFSFFIIGFVTVWFFKNSSEEYHEQRLERKTSSVLQQVQHEIELMMEVDSTLDLTSILKPVSKIHRMDINLYKLNGALMGSSEEDIFNKGIIDRRMGAVAFQALSRQKLEKVTQEQERIGSLEYKAAYVTLKNKSKQPIAYMGLPYYSKQSKLRSDITVFMSTLLNVYVFLLLIASGIAIATANSITRPLAQIGEKLKELKLGKRNEQLEWKSNDELGALINEYNKMIRKLEDSADKLAQSEREGAWREMAKQVAHEIKNPLTPMKLSIQYLQHAYNSNPEDIEPLLKRVSSTLIEQIDNLAQIASEFSNFAKMPRAENQKTLLNSLVGSVFDLFSTEDADLTLELPNEYFHVYADRNHLVRVLNNLIKNAIQAIPDERAGQVKVSLYKDNNTAIIKVKDNGSGISDDKREKVFVPNFTTKSSGTGLGLAISKNIIESVNGKIWFNTEVNIGTEFYVELPLVEITELEEA